jgi:hypothetical protein
LPSPSAPILLASGFRAPPKASIMS